jgi:hypothetical protein
LNKEDEEEEEEKYDTNNKEEKESSNSFPSRWYSCIPRYVTATSKGRVTTGKQKSANPKRLVAMVTKPCTVAPSMCGSTLRNLGYATLLAPTVFLVVFQIF